MQRKVATAAATAAYGMSHAEQQAVANELSNAAHEVAIMLHTMQCDAIDRGTYTPAVRVEIVLQLQALLAAHVGKAERAAARVLA